MVDLPLYCVTGERLDIANEGRAVVLIVAVVDQQIQRSPESNKVQAVSDLPRRQPMADHVIANRRWALRSHVHPEMRMI